MSVGVPPGGGTVLPSGAIIRVRAEQTGGAMAVFEQTMPPRNLIPPHTHSNDVWVYVLSGQAGVLVGDEIASGGPGSWLLKPRDVVHAMWNPGDEPARIIEILTPGGAEVWFEEIAALADDDDAGFDAACARHGLRFFRDSPWTEELRTRFGLD